MPPSHVQRVTDVMASLSKADSFWLTTKREVAWQTKFSTLFFHLIAPRCTALAVLTIRGNIAHSQGLGEPRQLVLHSKAHSFFWAQWIASILCFCGFENLEFECIDATILIPMEVLTQS